MVQEKVKVPGGGAARFSGVGTAFQNIGRGNNAPCWRNRVQTYTNFLGIVTVTDPVAIHLKYIDQQEVKVIEEVVDAEIVT